MGTIHHQSEANKISFLISTFIIALLMGVGVSLSGMASIKRSLSFFDWLHITSQDDSFGGWSGFLLFPLGAAFTINFIGFPIVTKGRPLIASSFEIPTNKDIDSRLIVGSILFGFGWALGGFCPGDFDVFIANVAGPSFLGILVGRTESLICSIGIALGASTLRWQNRSEHAKFTFVTVRDLVIVIWILAVIWFFFHGDATRTEFIEDPQLPAAIGLLSGSFIGIAILLMMALNGKVLGLSGLFGGLVDPTTSDKPFRTVFWFGFFSGGLIIKSIYPTALASSLPITPLASLVGGLLVGYGTGMANGCTSGHGVCGTSRLSPRSWAATATFIVSNALITSLIQTL